jgi:hypothetical protein
MAIDIDEIIKRGPPTREEVEAIANKWGFGGILDEAELARYNEYYATRANSDHPTNVLRVAYPNCSWTMQGEKFDTLEWDENNPVPKPTMADLRKLQPIVQDILDQTEYIKRRRQTYPQEGMLVRALWEWLVEGKEDLKNAVQARRLAVKKRFPKPESKHWFVQAEEVMQILPNTPQDLFRTDLTEEEMMFYAFRPGVEGADAQPLATRIQNDTNDLNSDGPGMDDEVPVTIADIDAAKDDSNA